MHKQLSHLVELVREREQEKSYSRGAISVPEPPAASAPRRWNNRRRPPPPALPTPAPLVPNSQADGAGSDDKAKEEEAPDVASDRNHDGNGGQQEDDAQPRENEPEG